MEEIEVKILNIDKNKVEQRLISLGAEKTFDDQIIDTYYDFPDNKLKLEKKVLRLRTMGAKTFITLKKIRQKSSAKIMEEYETSCHNKKTMEHILSSLGLVPKHTVSKHRTSYHYKDAIFDIDQYPNIPPLVEIEVKNKHDLPHYIKLLGFEKKDAKPWSVKELFDYYFP